MDVTIIGAGGDVGRALTHMIVAQRLLSCDQRLFLVGNPQGRSARSLFGFAVDLMDAYAEICPQIEVLLGPDQIQGDLIVMAGGSTVPADRATGAMSRDTLAQANVPVFEAYASALAARGCGHELVVCVSNPNELAVAVFAHHLGRERVVGMGAFLDSLRFRKEIALDLGVRRQRIHGFVAGEHGANMVPLWSSVHVYGFDPNGLRQALGKIRGKYRSVDFSKLTKQVMADLKDLIDAGDIAAAYTLIDRYPPDVRVALKPFITHFSGAKTAVGTAAATMKLLRTITLGHDALIAGQVVLAGEFHGLRGALGVPFLIGNRGVERVVEISLWDEERRLLESTSRTICEKVAQYVPKVAAAWEVCSI